LGIMLNLDWFQSFDNSQYSIEVMYRVILYVIFHEVKDLKLQILLLWQ
jgi:hypothetical protein